jgi:spermidine synthase
VVLVGQPESAKLDLDAFQARLSRPDHADVVRSLAEVGLGSMMDLLGTYAGHASQLQPWLDGAEINRDRNLRLQYLAGLSLNYYEAGNIYKEILAYRRFSEEFFAGSEQLQQILRSRLVPLSN